MTFTEDRKRRCCSYTAVTGRVRWWYSMFPGSALCDFTAKKAQLQAACTCVHTNRARHKPQNRQISCKIWGVKTRRLKIGGKENRPVLLHGQANVPSGKFNKRTDDAKIALFSSYCTSLCTAHLRCW